jgi:hypothetical protein
MFEKSKINSMKLFFDENSKKGESKMVCIVTLNHGVRMLYDNKDMKLGSQIDHSMNYLNDLQKIKDSKIIEFKDKNGKKTTGVTEPYNLSQSIYDVIIDLIGQENGFFVFGLSIMDGYHSVTIIVEKEGVEIKIFRCDQNEGCFESNRKELDEYIRSKTIKWWNKNAQEGKKMKTRATIWMLQP